MTSFRKSAFLILAVLLYLSFRGIGDHGLLDPLEGINASVELNMVTRGDLFIPMAGDARWLGGKTMGFWWLSSLALELFGWSEFSVRFWSALALPATAAAVWFAARRMKDGRAGNYAAVMAGTGLLAYCTSQLATSHALYAFFVTLALTGIVYGFRDRRFFLLLHGASILAFVVQGPAGLVLPWLALFLHTWLLEKERFFLDALLYLPGFAVTLLTGSAYLLLLYFKNPHLFVLMYHNPPVPEPLFRSGTLLLAGFCPWIGFHIEALTQTLPRDWDELSPDQERNVLLPVWGGVFLFFGFFSGDALLVSAAFPALAVLCGLYFADRTETGDLKAFQRTMLYEIFLMIPLLCFGLFRLYRHESGAVRNTSASMFPWAFFCCLFLFAGWYYTRTRQPKKMMLHTCLVSLICLLPLAGAFDLLAERASLRNAGNFLRKELDRRDTLVQYAMNRPSLYFYTAHSFLPVLTKPIFGIWGQKIQDGPQLLKMWNSPERVLMLIERHQQILTPMSREIYNLYETQDLVVLSNRKDPVKADNVTSFGAIE